MYAGKQHKFSRTWIKELRKYDKFDGVNGNPEQSNIKDTHNASAGLFLRLSSGGRMTFFVRGIINDGDPGRTQSTWTVGNAREMYLDDARNIAQMFKNYLAKGLDPIKARLKDEAKTTIDSILNDYLNSRKLKPNTAADYRKHIERLDSKLRTKTRVENITQEDIIKEHERITAANTPFMADKSLKMLNILFTYALVKYKKANSQAPLLLTNPVQIMNTDKRWNVNGGRSRRKKECIDTSDIKVLLNALEQLETYTDGIKHIHTTSSAAVIASHFFRFLLFTGWRPEEVVKIEWSQVSEDCSDITWNDEDAASKLKNALPYYRFPLNNEAKKVLLSIKNYKFDSPWIFPANNLESHFKQNPTLYIEALEKLTDKRYTAGIYRKTFQTYAEECKINKDTIKWLVFHTQRTYSVESGYIDKSRESFRKESQMIADYILYHAGRLDRLHTSGGFTIDSELDQSILDTAMRRATKTGEKYDEIINKWTRLGLLLESYKDDEITIADFKSLYFQK
ncbi:integrase arm-type DNA-binding domain-containing protein [uncultured Tolumonas sp.]|uniref:integrase arm-type DNA-binding domain-containing protein n=1 Tax=uncultured Tolumonas sp. TaxID=263765 RepID=UPI0029305D81|nr:integrase arm-type DNA-binding domain-containing protein [uncultured Tolumonas sp.]